jgi:hypothetical protein
MRSSARSNCFVAALVKNSARVTGAAVCASVQKRDDADKARRVSCSGVAFAEGGEVYVASSCENLSRVSSACAPLLVLVLVLVLVHVLVHVLVLVSVDVDVDERVDVTWKWTLRGRARARARLSPLATPSCRHRLLANVCLRAHVWRHANLKLNAPIAVNSKFSGSSTSKGPVQRY